MELLRGGEVMNVAGHDVGVQEGLIVGENAHVRAHGGGDAEFEFVGCLGRNRGISSGQLRLRRIRGWMGDAIVLPGVGAAAEESVRKQYQREQA